jgi:hypothetical protein
MMAALVPVGTPRKASGRRLASCTAAWPEIKASRSSVATWASDGSSGDIEGRESIWSEISVTPCLSCQYVTVVGPTLDEVGCMVGHARRRISTVTGERGDRQEPSA